MAPDQPEPQSDVLLFYIEEKFAACRAEFQPTLAKTSAYLMGNPYFFRSQAEPRFVLVSIPEYDWRVTLSQQERTALRQASEAAYLSHGYPPEPSTSESTE